MKRWIYIVALTDSRNEEEMEHPGDMLSFKHAFVDAEDAVAAYKAGFQAVELELTETRMNDYVVEVSA